MFLRNADNRLLKTRYHYPEDLDIHGGEKNKISSFFAVQQYSIW
jgi:hypothetical protein